MSAQNDNQDSEDNTTQLIELVAFHKAKSLVDNEETAFHSYMVEHLTAEVRRRLGKNTHIKFKYAFH